MWHLRLVGNVILKEGNKPFSYLFCFSANTTFFFQVICLH